MEQELSGSCQARWLDARPFLGCSWTYGDGGYNGNRVLYRSGITGLPRDLQDCPVRVSSTVCTMCKYCFSGYPTPEYLFLGLLQNLPAKLYFWIRMWCLMYDVEKPTLYRMPKPSVGRWILKVFGLCAVNPRLNTWSSAAPCKPPHTSDDCSETAFKKLEQNCLVTSQLKFCTF